jgi:hypothetical protein
VARVRHQFPQVSVGWASLTGQPLDEALHEADMRMYEDKRNLAKVR